MGISDLTGSMLTAGAHRALPYVALGSLWDLRMAVVNERFLHRGRNGSLRRRDRGHFCGPERRICYSVTVHVSALLSQ
jgi:hypothetical protein